MPTASIARAAAPVATSSIGRKGDATWWNDGTYYTGEVASQWRARGTVAPTVVGVSFGELWLLTQPGLAGVFVHDVMPYIESRLGQPVARRLLVGESMGGVNVLLLAAHAPRDTFAKAAALCPPLSPVSPFAPAGDLAAYISRSSASLRKSMMLLAFSRRFFTDDAAYHSNDPVTLAGRGAYARGPALYLSCGVQDSWGCVEGARLVESRVRAHGREITYAERPGGHCDIDVPSLARFLVE